MTLLEHRRARAKRRTFEGGIRPDSNLAQTLQAIDDCKNNRNMTTVDVSSYEAFLKSLGIDEEN